MNNNIVKMFHGGQNRGIIKKMKFAVSIEVSILQTMYYHALKLSAKFQSIPSNS